MALTFPDGWKELSHIGAKQREIETLTELSEQLPQTFRIYHGVHWTRIDHKSSIHGEIDFAILNPAGKLLMVEQKSGFLNESPEGLMKMYASTSKSVPQQIARSLDAIKNRLSTYLKGDKMDVEYLLYCPDYKVRDPGSAGITPERIVDATRRSQFVQIILSLLSNQEENPELVEKIHRFMTDTLSLVPDVNAFVGESRQIYTRLSGGLAQWARCLEFSPFRLRVQGTAGSGKTQLALAVLRETSGKGQRALYLCYNRPLADHIALIAPENTVVATYHQLADRLSSAAGIKLDFSIAGAFKTLENFMLTYEAGVDELFDVLIIDEAQDFHPGWRDVLLRLLKPSGKAWWLEDPMQNLYDRPLCNFDDWVTLRTDTNYRSPQDIVNYIGKLIPMEHSIEAGSPIAGSEVEILTYVSASDLLEQTKLAIRGCISSGFKQKSMAVVSFRGRENSLLTPYTQIGEFKLSAFTGKYDPNGNPELTEGDLVIDSVYRFKGKSAPCIVFTEIDFDDLDTLAIRKIFVGATRASMKLVLVISEKATRALIESMT